MEKGTCKQGVYVRDLIDGREGLVSGKMYWMFGCEKITVIPKESGNQLILPNQHEKFIVAEEFLELTGEESKYEKDFSVPNTEKWFGKKCRDKVTGIEGICVSCLTNLFSSDLYGLEWRNKKGKSDHQWFDEGRLEIIGDGVTSESVSTHRPGGSDIELPRISIPSYSF